MPVWRLQVAAAADTLFPADRTMITPHFNDHGATTNPQNLCHDLGEALKTYYTVSTEINVKAYDAQGTRPVYPQGDYTVNVGVANISSVNRDVALCLSYYADQNRPRYRGRLYLPCNLIGLTPSAARPTTGMQQKVADLVPILSGLGGIDVDWSVYSRTDNAARKVTNWWVDNNWDSQRRRGPRPTSRLSGSTSG